jgi:two-component system, response regulator YesN
MFEKFKVIIVDDEEGSRELIRMSVNWEAFEFSIIGEASNAEEALEMIDLNPPDLILTDINMPYIDGLELSELILKQYPETKVIVVTGFDEFEYAKRGIKAGVYDFIVKPIDEDELESTLRKVYRDMKNEREEKANYAWLKDQLENERPYLKEKFLVDLLYSHIDEQINHGKLAFTQVKLVSDCFQVNKIEIVSNQRQAESIEQQEQYLAYMFIANIRALVEHIPGVEVFIDNTNHVIILNSNKSMKQEMTKSIETINRWLHSHKGIHFVIGIGRWHEGFNQIKISYKEASEAVAYKIICGMNQIITYDDLIITKPLEIQSADSKEEQLALYIKSGILEESLAVMHQIFEKVLAQENIQLKTIRLKAIHLVMRIIQAMSEIGISIEKNEVIDTIFDAILQANALPEIKRILDTYVKVVCASVDIEQRHKQNSIIDKIDHFMEENIKAPLSLNSISEAFHLNKSYLSRIYKERTGVTLGERILSLKINKAIQLIQYTDKKAYEIAEELGYQDPNYFGNSFKKYTGKSISEFRKANK